MKIPQHFRDIAVRMHQDVGLILPQPVSGEDLCDYLVRGATAEQAKVAADFIDDLLAAGLSNDELAAVWGKAGAAFSAEPDTVVAFLQSLRAKLLEGGS